MIKQLEADAVLLQQFLDAIRNDESLDRFEFRIVQTTFGKRRFFPDRCIKCNACLKKITRYRMGIPLCNDDYALLEGCCPAMTIEEVHE